jgi:hypothetical protein
VTEVQKERVREWVSRLRSGRYKQGKVYLHRVTDNGDHFYNVLGIACEVACDAGVLAASPCVDFKSPGFGGVIYRYGADSDMVGGGHIDGMPLEVRDWLGVPYNDSRNWLPADRTPTCQEVIMPLLTWVADVLEERFCS